MSNMKFNYKELQKIINYNKVKVIKVETRLNIKQAYAKKQRYKIKPIVTTMYKKTRLNIKQANAKKQRYKVKPIVTKMYKYLTSKFTNFVN